MFARRSTGLFEFLMAALCLWAAWYHTPMGALLRRAGAWVLGTRTSARPLLAYYSGGAMPHAGERHDAAPDALPQLARGVVVTPELALGLGLHASLRQLPADRRAHARALAKAHGLDPDSLLDPRRGPEHCADLLDRARASLGSDDAAVLAAFAGMEPARYARDRALAEGVASPALEHLARHLPPGFEDPVAATADALAFGVAYGLGWPVPESTPISSGFGDRIHPVLGERRLHTGVDLPLRIGTPVRAVADGVVRRASEDGVNGRVLVIDHGRGVTTAYCHNSLLLVREGESVRRGDVIAHSGNTGRSTGPHLHYQLELGEQPVDPLAFRTALRRDTTVSAEGGP